MTPLGWVLGQSLKDKRSRHFKIDKKAKLSSYKASINLILRYKDWFFYLKASDAGPNPGDLDSMKALIERSKNHN